MLKKRLTRLRQLGGCFGEGCKVQGGYDFVGDNGEPACPSFAQ